MLADNIRDEIASLRSSTAVRIPSERDIAAMFQASRVSVRAALKVLMAEGLLFQKQGSGTFIKPKPLLDVIHLSLSPELRSGDPFYSMFMTELSQWLAEDGIALRMVTAAHTPKNESSPLIIVGTFDNASIDLFMKSYRAIVAVQSYPSAAVSQVHYDDAAIGSAACRELTERGHKRIAHIAGPKRFAASRARRDGFLDACGTYGIAPVIIDAKMNYHGGYETARTLMDTRRSEKTTGVFCANDAMACGLIAGLKENGVRIPGDIAVIGCDDIPMAAEITPALATFSLDPKELLAETVVMLNNYCREGVLAPRTIMLPARFIERESIAAQ